MSTLSWNCRRLRQSRTVQELVRLVHTYCPKIVFLSEIRQHKNRVINIKSRLGFNNCFVIEGEGKGGGLAMCWDDSIKLNIPSYRHINMGWEASRRLEGHVCVWRSTHPRKAQNVGTNKKN
jgi:hypothetical protein